MMSIIYRDLGAEEVDRIREIDRGEEIPGYYIVADKTLRFVAAPETVTEFDAAELDAIIARQRQLGKEGGRITGAFNDDKLVGVASVERKRRGAALNYCKMDILYVSKGCRGMKIGQRLVAESQKAARHFGADKLYISATPTKNTVDFYLRNGAVLTAEIDPVLFELEPDDLHLELSV